MNIKIRKRQSIELTFKGCIASKFLQGFLGFYRKVSYLLTGCNYKWNLDPFMLRNSELWKATLTVAHFLGDAHSC
jgi:hypothetical protein